MIPVIAIPDPDDAQVVFDALNFYYVNMPDTLNAPVPNETRQRVLTLLIAAHAETKRTDDNRETTP